MTDPTVRLTVAQAVVRFLAAQWTERDGERQKLFAGCFGIFGHGNVAGIGQALLENELHAEGDGRLPYVLARNEQAMVHTAVGYARQKDRLQTWVCTASVGPGSTNMLTGAALATINRIPVLLLPSGTFATRVSGPVLQELEQPYAGDVTVNDAFRPLSRFFDRVTRPEQLTSALLGAMRVLTDPVETGAVTIALPQDVQAEAFDWPEALFATRVWRIARPVPEAVDVADAAALIRSARRPLVVAGGGVHYSGAEDALQAFCDATGVPVGETQAGKGSLVHGHPQLMGSVGSTGTTAANALATEADVVIGVGTRWSDFTTASRTAFQDKGVRFVNVNVARFDAGKQSGLAVVADAREALTALTAALDGYAVDAAYRERQAALWAEWDEEVEAAYHPSPEVTDALADGLLTQSQVLGAVNELQRPARRGALRRRLDAGRPAQAVAGARPQGLPRRVRLLLHGLRGAGVDRHPPRRPRPRRLRHGRRRRLPHDAHRARHSGAGAGQGRRRARAEPRVPLDRLAVGVAGLPAVRHALPLPRRAEPPARRRPHPRRPRRQRPQPRRPCHRGALGARSWSRRSRTAKAWPADGGPVVIHVETDPFVFAPDTGAWWDVPVSAVSRAGEHAVGLRGIRGAQAGAATARSRPGTPKTTRGSGHERPAGWACSASG